MHMKKAAIVILPAFACVALFGRGESKPWPPDSSGSDQQRVLTLQQQWADAEVKHDAAALALILDDQFVVSYASGQPLNKAAFIAQAMKLSMASQTVTNDVIHIQGNTAIIVGTMIIHPLNSGESCRLRRQPPPAPAPGRRRSSSPDRGS
jgi:hypothetical protein